MQLFAFIFPVICLILYIGLILYYRQGWMSVPDYHPAESALPDVSVTIIIPARNEAENIGRCLDSILGQHELPARFEIIVVDDHSTDATPDIVQRYADRHVKLISLADHTGPGQQSYKKKAIDVAIRQSTGTLIITTDADCIVPVLWLRTIVCFYNERSARFIAMPVLFTNDDSFLEIFQSLDFMTLQGITGAAVNKHLHSMCNGANLAYEKQAFFEVGGFAGIDHIASGDDMLLMHKIAERFPGDIHYLRSKKVIVQTAPMKTWRSFFNQRIRWASKADRYDDKRIIAVLVMVYLFNLLLLLLPVISIFYDPLIKDNGFTISLFGCWLMLIVAKTIVELFFLYPVATFFNRKKLLYRFPLAQPFHIVYTIAAGWFGKFGTYKWKGRTVK